MAYSLWRVNVLDFSIADEFFDGLEGEIMICLIYTSDAADERSSEDLGGRRIIKIN